MTRTMVELQLRLRIHHSWCCCCCSYCSCCRGCCCCRGRCCSCSLSVARRCIQDDVGPFTRISWQQTSRIFLLAISHIFRVNNKLFRIRSGGEFNNELLLSEGFLHPPLLLTAPVLLDSLQLNQIRIKADLIG